MADWNESEHPRHPAGAPDSQGGEFRERANAMWAASLLERIMGSAQVSMLPWEEFESNYGQAYDEITLRELPDGSKLKLYSMPEQEVAALGLVSADGEQFGHMYDFNPKSLRNTWELWNNVDLWMNQQVLTDLEDEDGRYPDGSIVQVRLPSGEGFGWLPGGRYRWYPANGYPPVDGDRNQMNEMFREMEEFANTVETDIENYQDEQDRETEEEEK